MTMPKSGVMSPERIARKREYDRRWESANAERVAKRRAAWYVRNRDRVAEQIKARRRKNPSAFALYGATARAKPDYRASVREKFRERYAKDINFRLACIARNRIKKAISRNSDSSLHYLGCSIAGLREHIESLWRDGMSWENYGEWHIDHIKPLASFDLSIDSQMLEACNFQNLQPLWASDNFRKGARAK